MKNMPVNYDELRWVLSANDLSKVLRISKANATTYSTPKASPTLNVGRRLLVTKENLLDWMEENTDRDKNDHSKGTG